MGIVKQIFREGIEELSPWVKKHRIFGVVDPRR